MSTEQRGSGGTRAPAAQVWQLESHLQIQHVEEEMQRVLPMVETGAPLAIEIGKLKVVDTAGVQLLLAVRQEFVRRGTPVYVRGQSEALSKALVSLGLVAAMAGGPAA